MRLTAPLLKFKRIFIGKVPKFRGSALKGKHKFVPPVTRGTRYLLWSEWRDQEEVMKHISKPYVTVDQELDYLETVGLKHQDCDPIATSRLEPPLRQRYSADALHYFERSRKHEILE